MESLLKKVPDRYKIVVAAVQRAKALNLGEKPLVDNKSKNNAIIALEEISSGKIKVECKGKEHSSEKEKK